MDGKKDEFDPYPLEHVRSVFPMLSKLKDSGYVYLDSAATSLTPQPVIDAISRYYSEQRVTIHRGGYPQAQEVEHAFEQVRAGVAAFIGAGSSSEIVFTKSATEALNLVAFGWAAQRLKPDDEIVVSEMEHHANFVPWQQLAKRHGFVLKVAPVLAVDGCIDMQEFERLLSPKVRLVAVTGMSNVTGVRPPIREIADRVHAIGARLVVDGTQLVAHEAVSMRELGCDFLAFSAHKMCGPTGTGVLFGRRELLEEMRPTIYGGDMVLRVSGKRSVFQDAPRRFEGGTPHIAGVLGLGAAIKFLSELGMAQVAAHERLLTQQLLQNLALIPSVRLVGASPATVHSGVVSFVPADEESDVFSFSDSLGSHGVMLRSGKLCAHPYIAALGFSQIIRASFGLYTSTSDIDTLTSILSSLT